MKHFLVLVMIITILLSSSCSEAAKQPDSSVASGSSSDTTSIPDKPIDTGTNTPSSGGSHYIIAGTSDILEIRNDNVPYFTATDYEKARNGYFIELSPLDSLGRVGINWGCFDYYNMPTEKRTSLSTKPTGWVQNEYDIVSGRWLYNRSHIIGFQICGLNDEPKNLMTGTRAFNAGENSMLTFENMTSDHMREYKDHHVLYRVTPDFEGDNLLAYGVLIESDCLQCDDTADYCVYIANQQDGITIDYRTGDNWLTKSNPSTPVEIYTYILNTGTKKFHKLTCKRAPLPSSRNYKLTTLARNQIVNEGYSPCGICKP